MKQNFLQERNNWPQRILFCLLGFVLFGFVVNLWSICAVLSVRAEILLLQKQLNSCNSSKTVHKREIESESESEIDILQNTAVFSDEPVNDDDDDDVRSRVARNAKRHRRGWFQANCVN